MVLTAPRRQSLQHSQIEELKSTTNSNGAGLLHSLLETQANMHPERTAVQFEDVPGLSYNQLNGMANSVARKLVCGRGTIIPIAMERSISMVVAVLAVLKTGAAYVLLSPDAPMARNQFIVEDVKAPFVLVDETTTGQFDSSLEISITRLVQRAIKAPPAHFGNLNLYQSPSDIAYVIYTSGTTGQPKGVLLSHLAATTGISAMSTPNNSEPPRQLLCHSPNFSAAQRTILGCLCRGGTLCLASKENITLGLFKTLRNMNINSLEITPSMLMLHDPATLPSNVKSITLGGEPVSSAIIDAWADKVSLTSAYGLSECTQLNMRQRLSRGSPPTLLGKPTDSTTCVVLEPGTTTTVPVNTPGELCLGGSQLAKGYLGLKSKTRAAFIKNPFGPGRLYRTGDMVVLRDDGSMELVGRIDHQTKIDGQRVEPGEANAHVQRQLGVVQSHVVPATVLGRKALVAVVVSDQTVDWPALVREARAALRTLLPSYAVPSYWVEVEQMPLNTSGKVDVAGLVAMVEGLTAEELITPTSSVSSTPPAGTPPDDAFELKVLNAVAATLSLSAAAVSLDASFQELGGSSLNAIVLVGKLRAAGVQVAVPDILQAATLRDLRPEPALVTGEVPAPFSLLPEGSSARHTPGLEDAYPATPLQEGLCLESIIGSADYVYRRTYRIQGVEPAQVRRALETVISANPIFRTSFTQSKRSFIQSVRRSVELPWKEYRGVSLDRAIEDLKEDPLELDGPLVRATVLDDSLLVLEMHHCLFDFWSSKFLAADAAAVLRGDQPVDRPPFSAYVAFNRAYASEPAPRAFWQDYLAGATETVVDLPSAVASEDSEPFVLRANIGDALQRLSSATGVTVGAAVHAAWAMTLANHLGTDEATFLSAFAGRDANVAGILSLNGPTLCTVPMRVAVPPNSGSLEQFAKETQNNLWNVSRYAHSGLRDALAAASLRPSLFNTMVNVLAVPKTDAFAEDSALVPVDAETQNFTGYVCLELNEADPSRVKLLVPFAGVDRAAATALLELFVNTVEHAAANDDALNTQVEPRQPAVKDDQPFGLAHAAFEQRAAANASKVAVVESSGKSWSYGEMDAKANNFARHLVQQGVVPGEIIPLYMDKSALTLVAILAVLKAGAAFTPLDPRNPRERNAFIAQDVGAKRIVTDVRNGEECAAFGLNAVVPEQLELDEGDDQPVDVPGLSAASTAYLIYTSGSTGLPKGVVVPHSAVAASAEGMIEATAVTADWVALWTLNYVFDASYYDVFTVLSAGATLCVAPQDDVMSDLAGHINRMGVQQVMLTPTMAKLISGGPAEVPGLKVLNVCGEKIDSNIQEWAERIDVYNGYGPTEATILMTVSKVSPSGDLNSIGFPLRHATAVILPAEGSSLKRLPAGEVGELCVRGAHLATGYLNRPEQTAKAFVRDADGAVLYRTGDLARWAADGSLVCLGRKDYQVKLNGFRIELGEIENAVLRTDRVDAAIVSVAELSGKKQLVAFVVFKGDHEPNTQRLLAPEDKLPAIAEVIDGMHTITHYMMPSVFLPFSGFPTLPSGKADRKALVALAETTLSKAEVASYVPKNDDDDASEVEPVATDAERVMQAIWAAVLDQPLDAVGANSSFLALGGDSIAGINVAGQCRKKGFKIALSQVLALPTLREQAAKMEKIELAPKKADAGKAAFTVPEEVRRVIREARCEDDVEDVYPCGAGQIEFLTQGRKDRQFWNLTVYRDLPADFDLDAWKAATTRLTARNQVLRAFYVLADEPDPSSWYQVVLKFPTLDWAEHLYSSDAEKTALAEHLRDARFGPGAPHVRYRVLRSAADGARTLAIKLDHGSYDGTLLRIFQDQFAAIARGDSPLPPVVDFKQFIQWDAANDRAADLAYWHTRLRTPAPPPRPAQPLPAAPATDRLRFVPLQADVDAIAAKYGVTAMTVFSAVYALVAGRVLGTDDVVIDNLVAGRNADIDFGDAQALNGTCANFLPMRMALSPDSASASVSDWMAGAQNDFWESAEHGRVGLGDIYGQDRDAAGAAKLLFVFQPFAPAPVGAKPDPMSWLVMKAQQKIYMVMNYALAIEVQKTLNEEGRQGYRLKVQWDSHGLGDEQIDLAMGLFEGVLGRLRDGEKKEFGMREMVEFVGGF